MGPQGGPLSPVASALPSGAISLAAGQNPVVIEVSGRAGGPKTYTVTVTRQSSDATLSALTASTSTDGSDFSGPLTLNETFASGTTSYTATVANAVTHAKLRPTASHAAATVRVGKGSSLAAVASGSLRDVIALDVGANAISVEVTAEDETTRETYRVTVTRESGRLTASHDATLSALSGSTGRSDTDFSGSLTLSPAFAWATTSYTASVLNSATHVKLTPTANESNAAVKVGRRGTTLVDVRSGSASTPIALTVGANILDVEVTPQSGAAGRKTYTVTVTRHTGICGRTEQVRNALVAAISGVDDCADVTAFHLAGVTVLNLGGSGLAGLKTGDFDGLAGLQGLGLHQNNLTWLPEDVFDGLTALTQLAVFDNALTSLPDLSDLTALQVLQVNHNALTSLPDLSDLTALQGLGLHQNNLTSLPEDVFDGLAGLLTLTLSANNLTSLPEDVFDGLAGLLTLTLSANNLTSLPDLSDLTALTTLHVHNNLLTSLPDLSTHTRLRLGVSGNPLSNLSALTLTDSDGRTVALNETFDGGTTGYTAVADSGVNSVTVTPTAADVGVLSAYYATLLAPPTIKVGPQGGTLATVASGSASEAITLGVGGNPIDIEVTGRAGGPKTYTVTVTGPATATGICGRTEQVRDALVAAVSGVDDCADVTATHLAGVTGLDLGSSSIAGLKTGDFDGLTGLISLFLWENALTSLPELSGLTALNSLFLDTNNLTSLPDLSGLTALRKLTLGENDLTSPDLSGLTKLAFLELYGNPLTSPDLSGLTALEYLGMSETGLRSLPDLGGLTALGVLDVSYNDLMYLPDLSKNTALASLDVSDNDLRSLPDLSKNTALYSLDVSTNVLRSLPDLSKNTALYRLDVSTNVLRSLPDLSKNTALNRLDVSDNDLRSLPDLSKNTALNRLDVSYNDLMYLPDLSKNTALASLDVSDNDLRSLPDLSKNTALNRLDVSGNPLSYLSALTLTGSDGKAIALRTTFEEENRYYSATTVTGLTSVTVTPTAADTGVMPTRLASAFPGPAIKVGPVDGMLSAVASGSASGAISLTGGSNRIIIEVNGRAGGPTTYSVAVTRPGLRGICGRTEQVRDALVSIIVGVNDCADVTATHLAGVTGLDLRRRLDSGLNELDFDGLTALAGLNLGYNDLRSLPDLSNLTALEYLEAAANDLTSLPDLSKLTALRELEVAGNDLTSLPDLSGLTALEYLDVAENDLTSLPDLSGLTALEDLDVSNNPLSNLSALTLTGSDANAIDFSETFDGGTTSYTAVAAGGVTSVTVTPTAADTGAVPTRFVSSLPAPTIKVGPQGGTLSPVVSGSASGAITLGAGDTAIDIEVTGRAGGPKTYTVTVTRQFTPVCNRTAQVRDALVAAMDGVSDCAEVTATHLAGVTLLDLSYDLVTGLKTGDFDGLAALTELNVSDNALTSLPDLSDLTTLIQLDASDNALTSLPDLSGLTALEELDVSGNSLTSPDLSGLTALVYLGMSDNDLTSLPDLGGLTALEELDVSGNNLTSPDLSGLTALVYLGMSDNDLTSLPDLSRNTALAELDVSGNSVSGLPAGAFEGLSSLTTLNLSDNPGAPFALSVGLERTDGALNDPSPATLKVTVREGAPEGVTVPLSVSGGTASMTEVTVPAGEAESPTTVTVTQSGADQATANVGTLATPSTGFQGISYAAADGLPLTLWDTAPTVEITGVPSAINATNAFTATFTFSEDVTEFVTDDVTVTGGTKGAFSGSGKTYTLTVTPSGNTDVVVTVAQDAATDGINTGPASAVSATATWDAAAPTVTITGVPSRINATSAFTATFTFSEDVTGFETTDVTVTGGTKGTFSGSGKTYTLAVTPSGNADVVVTVAQDAATDGVNTGPASAVTATATWDAAAPTVEITGVPSAINAVSAFTVTFTFSEDVTGFVTEDVTVTGGTKGTFSGSGKTYTLLVTPSGNADVVVTVAQDAATDGANTGPSAAVTATATWDAAAPTVEITGVPSRINATDAFTATFTFSEDVTGFVIEDVTVTGGTKVAFSGSGKTYTLLVTPSGNANVVVTVAQDATTDGVNTGPSTAVTATATWDAAAPTVTITGVPSAINSTSAFTATFTFSEDVTGFATTDVTVTGGTKGTFSGSGKTYTLAVTPSGNANVVVTVAQNAATDGVNTGPASTVSATATWDAAAPTVEITGVPTRINATSAFTATFTFSENVTGFVTTDVTVTGGTKGTFSGSGKTYTLLVTPSGNTNVVVTVAQNAATDGVNTGPSTAVSATATWDAAAPTVTITGVPTRINATSAFTATFTFSENVTGFETTDVTVTGGTKGTFSGSGKTYTLLVTPSGNANVVVTVAADAATDGVNTGPATAVSATATWDAAAPTVTITGVPTRINATSAFTATFTFSENVTGFETTDVTVTGGTKGTFSGSGKTYTLAVTPSGNTNVVVTVAANAATDGVNTGPASAVSATATWDAAAPTVAITGVPSAINATSAFTATFTFSENVTGFETTDVTVTGGTKGAFSGSGKTYTLAVTPSGNADVVVTVAADAATDGVNTGPASAVSATATWDAAAPTVAITGVPSAINATSAFTATFTFSEDVTGFATTDVTVTGGTKGTFSGSGQTYTLLVTPSGNADVVVTVAADAATDGVNTGPASAVSATATWDTAAPTVTITGVPTRINATSAFTATFTFSEDVTGFVTEDVTVTGGTKGAFSGSGKTYTLAVTPSGNADVVVTVAANAATDGVNTGPASAVSATATWDTAAPTVTITGVPARINATSAFTATFTFSEDVTGFATTDVTVTGGTKGTFSGSGKTYTLAVTPAGNANVVVTVAQNAATDGVNTGPASTVSATATWDAAAPTVTITGVPARINATDAFTATFTFSENVTGFETTDVTVTGGTKVAFSGSGQTYTLLVTPSGNADVVVTVAQNAATDGVNTGPASTVSATATWDAAAPTVAITAAPNPVDEGSDLTVTATLSASLAADVTIPLTVDGGTSEQGDLGTLSSIRIAGGATSGTGTITTSVDSDTDDETITVTLGTNLPDGVTAGVPASVLVTIADRDGEAPGRPRSLQVTAGDGRLDLAWAAPTSGTVISYVTEYKERSASEWTVLYEDDYTDTKAAIEALEKDTRYDVRVRASNIHGEGPWATGSGMPTGRSSANELRNLSVTASETSDGTYRTAALSPSFRSSVTAYTAALPVPAGTVHAYVKLRPTESASVFLIIVHGHEVDSGAESPAIAVGHGSVVWIGVIPLDHTEAKEYSVTMSIPQAAIGFGAKPYAFELGEGLPGPIEVGRVAASDPDGGEVAYALAEGGDGRFKVRARDGAVTYTGPGEDYEAEPNRYELTVVVGGEEARARVVVEVTNLNEAPVAVDAIPEQAPGKDGLPAVLDLTPYFDDPDGDPLTYTAASSDPTAVAVSIDGSTLTLTSAGYGSASVEVTARDPGGLKAALSFVAAAADGPARVALDETLAAMARGYLVSARMTLGRRVRPDGAGARSRLTVKGNVVPLDKRGARVAAERMLGNWAVVRHLRDGGLAEAGRTVERRMTAWAIPPADGRASDESPDPAKLAAALGLVRPPALGGLGRGGDTEFAFGWGAAGAGAHPRWQFWGQGDLQRFAGDPSPERRYNGDLRTGWVGLERAARRWLLGIAVSRSRGAGNWRAGADGGRLETSLTAAHPYLRWSDGATSLWAMAGGGRGTAENAHAAGRVGAGTLDLRLGLLDGRRRLTDWFGLRADAAWARLVTRAGAETVDGRGAAVHQQRIGIELSPSTRLRALAASAEASMRRDGGAGQTGSGLELSGGLAAPAGPVLLDAQGRILVLHSAQGYRERGLSVTFTVGGPDAEEGLSLSVSPRYGSPATGAGTLWNDRGGARHPPGINLDGPWSLDARGRWAIRVPGGRLFALSVYLARLGQGYALTVGGGLEPADGARPDR